MATTALKSTPRADAVKTGLSASYRKEMSGLLVEVLGDTMVLMVRTQVCHWNVVGPVFFSVHKLTEEHYKDLFAAADEVAERIRSLGHTAPLNMAALTGKADIAEESHLRDTAAMIAGLAGEHEKMSRNLREITSKAADAEDFVTHDLLNARLAFHEQAVWMLRAIIAT
jgi:starvation-inducible DNA-binding protein